MIRDKEIFSKILEKYDSGMTTAEQRIADYLLKNPHESITLSVSSLAQAADTSEATVVRFAKTLGFSGYLELKAELLRRVSRDLADPSRYQTATKAKQDSLLTRVAETEVANISETIAQIPLGEFEGFADALRRAKIIYTLGSGMSSVVSRMAAYQLTLLGRRALCLPDNPASFQEQLQLADPKDDALWIFSFPPYSASVLEAAKSAHERRLPVLAITDRRQSPAARHAQHALCAANENALPINSVAATVVVVTALLSQMARQATLT